VPNFVKIGQAVVKILRFSTFQDGGRLPSWIDAVVFIIDYEHFNIWRIWLENAYSRPQNWGFWAI